MVSLKIFGASALATLAAAQDSTALAANAIQSGSFFDGSDGLGAESTQALATTSQNNFINVCSGKTLTNGLQQVGGSCNGIPMGDIPSKTNMISTVITNPKLGQTVQAGVTFNITVQVTGLAAGAFTNADATYYSSPQALNANGLVIGHTHVTVQDMGSSLNPTKPPDATRFVFFKGINDAGNGAGLLSATVTNGIPAGNYRVCTLTSAANHQMVAMPVAQRGSQDDCTKFTVTGSGGTTNAAANDGTTGESAAAAVSSAVALGPGALTTAGSGSGSAATSVAASQAATATGFGGGGQFGSGNGFGAPPPGGFGGAGANGFGAPPPGGFGGAGAGAGGFGGPPPGGFGGPPPGGFGGPPSGGFGGPGGAGDFGGAPGKKAKREALLARLGARHFVA